MVFCLTSEGEMVKKMVREFVEKEVKPVAAEIDEKREFPREILGKMGPLGLMGMLTPVKYGGAEMDYLSFTVSVEELARGSATVAAVMMVHNCLCSSVINNFGSDKLKEKFLGDLATGRKIGALALTEEHAGSRLDIIDSRAIKTDEGYVLRGAKKYVLNGAEADVFIVFARVTPRGGGGLSAFLVERGVKGLEIGKPMGTMGLHGAGVASINFKGLVVPEENLLGGSGKGFEIAAYAWDNLKIGVAAMALGISEAAFEESVLYVNQRKQFGQVIGRFQAVQEMIAEMATKIEAARYLTYAVADKRSRGEKIRREAAMAKFFTAEAATEIAKKAIKLHGGYGYIKDFPVERFARDAWATRIMADPPQVQKALIADEILGYEEYKTLKLVEGAK